MPKIGKCRKATGNAKKGWGNQKVKKKGKAGKEYGRGSGKGMQSTRGDKDSRNIFMSRSGSGESPLASSYGSNKISSKPGDR